MNHPPRALSRALAVLLTAGALALTPSAAQAVDPIAGPQTSGDVLFPNVGNGGYDVTHYDLAFTWNPPPIPVVTSEDLAAVATITAATTGAPLSSFSFDMEGLTVSAVTVDGTPAAAFTRVTDAAATKFKLVVTPATPVDGVFTTVVTYSGDPVSHTDGDGSSEGWGSTSDGVIFLNQPVGAMTAFPNNNTPSDKATFDIKIDIPSTISAGASAAVSNGELVSNAANTPSSGRTTWVWKQEEQMATMATLISIGRYDMTARNISLASGRTLPEWTFIDPTATGAAGAATAATNLKAYIDFFETRYGPYPGNSTGIVVDSISPTAGINYALETQDRAFFPNSVGASTNIHETMHQWWGDAVSPQVWNDIWISEGAASFSEVLYPNEGASPPTSATTTEDANYSLWNSTGAGSANWTVPPADMGDDANLFGWQTYNRSEMTFEALKAAIGTASFNSFMAEYVDRFNGASPGTAAFIDLAEEISGKELTAFFQDWIYDADKPAWPGKFNLSVSSTPASGAVAAGAPFSYTLTAANTGKVALTGKVVQLDLAAVLDDAAIGTLPADTTLDGTVLTWNVPSTATAASSTAVIPFMVDAGATSGTMTAVASIPSTTLGGTCTACTSVLSAGLEPVSPSADPTVGGVVKVGQTLSAVTDGWAAGTSFAYQWKRGAAGIPGATGSTYALVAADLGAAITVEVTGSKAGFNPVTRASAPTAAVVAGDQVLTPTPTVAGTAKVGSTLTATVGTWDDGVTLGYQWNANGAAIPGATGTTYEPVAADVGKTLTFSVTGTRPGYTTEVRTSAPTAAVAEGTQSSTPTPTITGTPQVGATLTAVPGSWDSGVTKSYQWAVAGIDVGGANGTTYTPVAADLGKTVTVAVTGTRSGYQTVTRTSLPTSAVAEGTQDATPTPTIAGLARVGERLTANPGAWDSGVALTFQWKRNGVAIPGATASTYDAVAADQGKRLAVSVTGTRSGYTTATRTSAETAAVLLGVIKSPPKPVIIGKAKVGRKLTVKPGTWPAGVTLRYQWFVNGNLVEGATKTTVKLTRGLKGMRVTVKVTGSRPGYLPITMTSKRTKRIVGGRP